MPLKPDQSFPVYYGYGLEKQITGDWSDLTHWATTSGGATFHTQLPGPTNDVYFDVNSFTMAGQIVTLDLEVAEMRSLICTGVTGQPELKGVGFYDDNRRRL